MNTSEFLSIPENRTAVRLISQQVLAELEPDELEASAGLIDPLIDMAARGEVITVDTSDEAGGLGEVDLMVMVVVPVVVAIVGNLLTKLGELGIEALKEKLKRKKREKEARDLITSNITVGDIEVVVIRTQSRRGKRRTRELVRVVNVVLLEYLQIH